MVHPQQLAGPHDRVKEERPHRPHPRCRPRRRVVLALLLTAGTGACEDGPTAMPPAAFGLGGEIRVDVHSPLVGAAGQGELHEILIWASNGPWLLTERVFYQGNLGAETLRSGKLNPGELAREYRSLIQQLNETRGLRLFGREVPQDLLPECTGVLGLTRVVFTIHDKARGEVASWTRCAEGTLFTFTPASAKPDPGASRIVTAGQLTRFFTLGEAVHSTYMGTIPFASLAAGVDSPARAESPRAFVSDDGTPPADFIEFWADHAGEDARLPQVDWGPEMVLLLAVGVRSEAGSLVRVRRVLPLGPATGTRVEVTERVPGDFCSPASASLYPFQLVILPGANIHLPIDFTPVSVERVSCGA